MNGEFYLHENGSVIYKPQLGFIDNSSPMVKRSWRAIDIADTSTSFVCWLTELFLMGANRNDIEDLARKNELERFHSDWEYIVFGER